MHDIKVDESGAIFVSLGAPYIYKYNKEGERERTYKCYYDREGKKEEVGIFKMVLMKDLRIIGINPFTNCIFSKIENKIKERR